ncbi:PASTA domain-containing protein [Paenibacillaceae bacterium]|nr:PASTA domain-containing protein [Paenibacillaceae bacterium]
MTKRIKLRTLLVGGVITLLFAVLLGRVYVVQVVHADFWLGEARKTWVTSEPIIASRGTIADRNGNLLAMDVPAYTVAINPKRIHELKIEDDVVNGLHQILGKPIVKLQEDVNKKRENGVDYVVQREVHSEGWKIDRELADKVEELADELRKKTGEKGSVGVYLLKQQKRYYPKNTLASHVLGYMQKTDEARYGLELFYDEQLRGEDGLIKYEKDGKRLQLADGQLEYKPAKDGKNLKLTIDTDIQWYIEEALKEVTEKYKPKSATAIAADPNTMEILGMANYPDFNPNVYWEANPEGFANHAVRSLYEPGSTFKIVTLAGAVQEGIFDPEDTYMSGTMYLGKSKISDHNSYGWGEISYLDGLKHSSNLAFVKLGYEKMGAAKLMEYIQNFGFSKKTGIELPGEVSGLVNFNFNIKTEVATATYGQGRVQVTPLQQVAAVAAVANGGRLMEPILVKSIEDPITKEVVTTQPKMVRQVISEKTSREVSEYLEQVVSDKEIGTGKNAFIEGYRVAGKTGTAQKVISGSKEYSTNKFVVSFIGYAPVEDPKIVVYVVVDEPNDRYAGGGKVAAPVFKQIVEKSLRHLGVAPTSVIHEGEDGEVTANRKRTIAVPDLMDLNTVQAQNELKQRSLSYDTVGKGKTVLQQIPKAGTIVPTNQRIYLITEERKQIAIPDMTGISLRDALEVCSLLDVRCVMEGEGYVVSQTQDKVNGEAVLRLRLAPPDVKLEDLPADELNDTDEETDGAAGNPDSDGDSDTGDNSSTTEDQNNGDESGANDPNADADDPDV